MVEINRNIYLSICIVNVIEYICVLKVYSDVNVCDKIYVVLVYWLFL